MAEAIVSAVAQKIVAIISEQIQNKVILVSGVEEEFHNLSNEMKTIRNVLDDAERRRFKEKSINDWLKKLEDTAYEMDDVLNEWRYAILQHKIEKDESNKHKVRSFIPSSCLCFKKVIVRHDIAIKIRNVKAKLDKILNEKDRYNLWMAQPTTEPSPKSWRTESTSFINLSQVYGRKDDRNTLVSQLLAKEGSDYKELGIPVVSIVGGGGLGKTTLAQLVYNDSRVKGSFELRIWVYVSDPFDEVGIAKKIVESVQGHCPTSGQFEMILTHLRDSILGKRFLLILDDVWNHRSSQWEPLKASLEYGGVGSKILVTTRNRGVAMNMGTIENRMCCPNQLSQKDCWLLLRHLALRGRNGEEFGMEFQDVGMKIAEKCQGLPLAAKVLGSLLSLKKSVEEWESILNSELWQMEEAEVEIFPHLLLSYNELSPAHKHCFSYCAIFPKNSYIEVEELIGCWLALGYLDVGGVDDKELRAQKCFNNLVMRSLFQDFVKDGVNEQIKFCRMHDVIHDFAQFLRKSDRMEVAETSCQDCDPVLISKARDYRSLFCSENVTPKHFDCLKSLRVLEVVGSCCPRGIGNLIHLRWLNLSETVLSEEDMETICKLYDLQTLVLRGCELTLISWEIGNLVQLRHLNLANNKMQELPESLCGLRELRTLNIESCRLLKKLPEGMHKLENLKHLHNKDTGHIPQVDRLVGLQTLGKFDGGSALRELRMLKNLNSLTSINLDIKLDDELEHDVENAREAELSKKKHLQKLAIQFHNTRHYEKKVEESMWMKLIDALEPHPTLKNLTLHCYNSSKLGGWTISSFNQLRFINLNCCRYAVPLGKLPRVEEIEINEMSGNKVGGREFLGLTTMEGAASTIVLFPKLKKLKFRYGYRWKEWEDITEEEEKSASLSLMPCLEELTISECRNLKALPNRLLRKATSLQVLDISDSTLLIECYGEKDSSGWKSISRNNPRLQLKAWHSDFHATPGARVRRATMIIQS